MSASYFDEGSFQNSQSGVTFLGAGGSTFNALYAAPARCARNDPKILTPSPLSLSLSLSPTDIAMYKTHESRDYVLWAAGMTLQWRNEETSSGAGACPTTWPWPPPGDAARAPPLGDSVAPLTTDTLTFMYTWPAAAAELTYSGKRLA